MNMSKEMYDEITGRFSYHLADAEGVAKMDEMRQKIKDLAFHIEAICPNGREKATALTHLQTVMMFANAAIVQQYPVK